MQTELEQFSARLEAITSFEYHEQTRKEIVGKGADFVEGFKLAIELLKDIENQCDATAREQSAGLPGYSTFSIVPVNRAPGKAQTNIFQMYIAAMQDNPDKLAGFGAVFSDYFEVFFCGAIPDPDHYKQYVLLT